MKGGGGEDLPGRGLGGGQEANEAPAQDRHPDGAEVFCGVGCIGLHDDHPNEGGGVVSYQQVPAQGRPPDMGEVVRGGGDLGLTGFHPDEWRGPSPWVIAPDRGDVRGTLAAGKVLGTYGLD